MAIPFQKTHAMDEPGTGVLVISRRGKIIPLSPGSGAFSTQARRWLGLPPAKTPLGHPQEPHTPHTHAHGDGGTSSEHKNPGPRSDPSKALPVVTGPLDPRLITFCKELAPQSRVLRPPLTWREKKAGEPTVREPKSGHPMPRRAPQAKSRCQCLLN